MTQVIQLDPQGFFVGFTEGDESPLEPGVLLLPGGCILAEEPAFDPDTHSAQWDGAAWTYAALPGPEPLPPAPTEADLLAAWRDTRVLTRTEFCTALLRADKLTAAEAIAAAGGATPAPLEDAISMLPEPEQAEARILWAGLTQVRRNHPLIALVAWVPSVSMTDAQVDELFGWPPAA